MDEDTRDCAERRAAEQAMTIDVRGGMPTDARFTADILNIGPNIGATHVIIEVGTDDDGNDPATVRDA